MQRSVTFGVSRGSLTTVGYALRSAAGMLGTRTTAGVAEVVAGSGIYAADVDESSGPVGILWDTGAGGATVYAAEDFADAAVWAARPTRRPWPPSPRQSGRTRPTRRPWPPSPRRSGRTHPTRRPWPPSPRQSGMKSSRVTSSPDRRARRLDGAGGGGGAGATPAEVWSYGQRTSPTRPGSRSGRPAWTRSRPPHPRGSHRRSRK